jgi:hypothetical protein
MNLASQTLILFLNNSSWSRRSGLEERFQNSVSLAILAVILKTVLEMC